MSSLTIRNLILISTTQSINWRDSDHRSSSATAYLSPVETKRTNWLTLTKHMVRRIYKKFPLCRLTDLFEGHQNHLEKRRYPYNRFWHRIRTSCWWRDKVYSFCEEGSYRSRRSYPGMTSITFANCSQVLTLIVSRLLRFSSYRE